MRLILFTSELSVTGEAAILKEALQAGFYRVHVKRRSFEKDSLRLFLDQFEDAELNRFVLHSEFDISAEYPVAGVHLPEKIRQESYVLDVGLPVISSSFHTIADFEKEIMKFEYGFIGPVFNSISKPGYQGVPALLAINDKLKSSAVPVGGITPGNIQMIVDSGFSKAAINGFVWEHTSPSEAVKQFVSTFRTHMA